MDWGKDKDDMKNRDAQMWDGKKDWDKKD